VSLRDLDVDDVLFEFLERVQRIEAPTGGRLVDDAGLTYAAACECGGTERVFAAIKLRECEGDVLERWICAECDQLWVFNRGEIAVHEVQVPRAYGPEHALGEIEELKAALELLSLWETRLYLQLFLWEDLHDRAEIAKIANRRWHCSRWSEWKVRQTISGAQKKIHRRLNLYARARKNPDWTLEDHRR
jgi:hypothetical protein